MSEEINKEKFSIIKLVPITVLITILSQIAVLSYYNNFNFSPITYFETYEIIIASLKDFIIIAFLTIVFFQFILSILFPVMDFIEYRIFKSLNRNREEKNKRERRIYNVKLFTLSFFMLCTLILILSIIGDFENMDFTSKSIIIGATIFSFISINIARAELLFELKYNHPRPFRKFFPYIDTMFLLLITICVVSILSMSHNKYVYVMQNNPYEGSELLTSENELIKCTTETIFIGKSQKYYFLYERSLSSVRIIKRDDLKKELLKVNPKVNLFYRF